MKNSLNREDVMAEEENDQCPLSPDERVRVEALDRALDKYPDADARTLVTAAKKFERYIKDGY
jgi:hypothetical protein